MKTSPSLLGFVPTAAKLRIDENKTWKPRDQLRKSPSQPFIRHIASLDCVPCMRGQVHGQQLIDHAHESFNPYVRVYLSTVVSHT
jgi:hypothetical protein